MNRRQFLSIAALSASALAVPSLPAVAAPARGLTGENAFYHAHTGKTIRAFYRESHDALQRLNRFLKDWRTGDVTDIDPALFSLLDRLKVRLGKPDAVFHVVSAYRSPKTNAMLRARSKGVAKFSLHLTGQAIDFRVPGARLADVRDAAIALGGGGVGYYQNSNFVHVDTGAVRTWAG